MNAPVDHTTPWVFIGIAASVIGVVIGLVSVTGMIGPAAIPIWGATALFGWLTMKGPLGHALAARLGAAPDQAQRLEVPEEIYAELDELRARMLEMEERQDFAERLLASRTGDDTDASGGGADG